MQKKIVLVENAQSFPPALFFCVQENHFDMTFLRRIWEKNYLQVVKKGDNSAVTALLQELLVNRFYGSFTNSVGK